MINFNYEFDFTLDNESAYSSWIESVINHEGKEVGEIEYIFVSDDYLYELNQKFLNHDTLTDIITFDNTLGDVLGADIFISIERVQENSDVYGNSFKEELRRVMVHGVLHLCGYKDKSEQDIKLMRRKEDQYLSDFSE